MREIINILTEEATKAEIEQVLTRNGYSNLKTAGNKIAVLVQIPDGEKKEAFRVKVLQNIVNLLTTQVPTAQAQTQN